MKCPKCGAEIEFIWEDARGKNGTAIPYKKTRNRTYIRHVCEIKEAKDERTELDCIATGSRVPGRARA
jgi:hypothetical protein